MKYILHKQAFDCSMLITWTVPVLMNLHEMNQL